MNRNILIVGHADGDGHVITEQTRRNLAAVRNFSVSTFVDPVLTRGHQVWEQLNLIPNIEIADYIIFVDLMFSPKLFVPESERLVSFAKKNARKRFFLIDHHPLPQARLSLAGNLRAIYRPDVFHCTIGPRSGLMVLAALLERQNQYVSEVCDDEHKKLALGVRRAAAPGSELPGAALSELLASKSVGLLKDVAEEDDSFHKLVRGRRVSSRANSPWIDRLALTFGGDSLSKKAYRSEGSPNTRGNRMVHSLYDERFEYGVDRQPIRNAPPTTHDLESIVTLLEFAAISLTRQPGDTFTRDELIDEAAELCGDDALIESRDVDIVLEKAPFLKGNKKSFSLR